MIIMMRALVLLLMGGIFFTSCRSTKKIQTALVKKDSIQVNVLSDLERARLDSIVFIREQYTQLQSSVSSILRSMQNWMWIMRMVQVNN